VSDPADATASVGHGLLGFSTKNELGRGEEAYLKALGLSKEDVQLLLSELREGVRPLTRR
jgi:hypothetical protein